MSVSNVVVGRSWLPTLTALTARGPDAVADGASGWPSLPNPDTVLLGLAVLIVVAALVAVRRATQGGSTQQYLASVVGAACVGVLWWGVAPIDDAEHPRAGLAGTGGSIMSGHGHDEPAVPETSLLTTEALSRHLAHLSERDFVVTESQQQTADLLLDATRREADRYADLTRAVSDGYVQVSPPSDGGPLTYLYDRGFVRDRTWLDPGRPQALVYYRAAALGTSDAPRLIGVAFLAPVGEGPRLGGGRTIWFPHGGLCLDGDDGVVAWTSPTHTCPSGSRTLDWPLEALHVWLFDNPNGAFAGRLTQEAVAAISR
jgi:hypothetical protein